MIKEMIKEFGEDQFYCIYYTSKYLNRNRDILEMF